VKGVISIAGVKIIIFIHIAQPFLPRYSSSVKVAYPHDQSVMVSRGRPKISEKREKPKISEKRRLQNRIAQREFRAR
jgi:hypothetical protein